MTTTSFNVSWGSVSNATSYRLDVSTDLFRTFVSGYENLTVNGTTQSITGLTPGTTYYVRVRAVNNKVIGPNSSILIQSTVTVAPNQPTISNVTVETFTASWNNVIGASSYRIDVATTSNFTSGFVTGYNNQTVTGTSINVVDLSPGTTYYVRVRAVNDQTVNPVTSTNSVSAVQSTQVLISSAPTAGNITTTSFTANWTNPGNAVSYRLDVSTVSNFATRLTGYDNLTVNTRSQSITGLTPGTTYYVRVRSVNSVGVVSANSSSLIQVTVPRAPVQLNIESISSSTISLSWNPVNGASSYRIDVATNNQFSNPIYVNREENDINHTISSLSSATTYYIRVRAINNQTANAVISANSTAISVLTLPNSINQLSVSAINTTGFTVNWVRVAGAINYQLDVSTVSNFSSFVTGYQNLIVNDIRQVITGLNPGETYYVRVRSVNSSGSTTNSPVLTQQTKLIVPSNLNVTGISTTNFTISWGSVLNATGYFIDVSEKPDFATRLINYDNLLVNNTSQQITGLIAGTVYYVRVRALSNLGTSDNSSILTQITVPTAPNQPIISNITSNTFKATWGNVIGASSYRIDVATTSNFTSGFIAEYNNKEVTSTTINIENLSPGITYYVRIRAVNDKTANIVTSENSVSAIQITTLAPPGTLTATNITTTSFTANWGIGVNVTSYRIDVSDPTIVNVNFPFLNNFLPGYENLTVNSTTQSITGLTPGKIYYVRVRSVNSNLISENSSSLIQITIPTAPNQPTISQLSSTSFRVTWNSVIGASSYRLDVATSSNFTTGFVTNYNDATVGTTSSLVVGLIPGTVYHVRVRAINDQTANTVTSANSVSVTQVTILEAPSQPISTAITTTSFTANWGSVTNATSYRLDVSNVSNFATRLPGYDNLVVNGTSQPITNLATDTTYYVRVRSINSVATSINSLTLAQNITLYNQMLLGDGINNSDGTISPSNLADRFGTTVKTNDNGNVLIMGGPWDDEAGFVAGAGLVYVGNMINGWTQKQKLLIPDNQYIGQIRASTYTAEYGLSLATNNNGNIIVIGGPEVSFNGIAKGTAAVFVGNSINGWNFKQLLTTEYIDNNIQQGYPAFGTSVASNAAGNVLMMGGISHTGLDGQLFGQNAGAALVFTGNSIDGWKFKQRLVGDSSDDFFGRSVAVDNNGTVLFMGGDGDDDAATNAGAVLIYTGNSINGWNLRQKITGDIINCRFGRSVVTNNNSTILAVNGAAVPSQFNECSSAAGCVPAIFIYTGNSVNGWNLRQKITGYGDLTYGTLAMNSNGTSIVVGNHMSSGSVSVFTGNATLGWGLKNKFLGYVDSREFGRSVSINSGGEILMVGAPLGNTIGNPDVGPGAAFVYSL
jgi:hypothetical protein